MQKFYFCLIKFCSKSRATLSACSTNTTPPHACPFMQKKKKRARHFGALANQLIQCSTATGRRHLAAASRRVVLHCWLAWLFGCLSLFLSQSLALCWAVCLPHPACQTAVPTRCHWWGPPNWHAWLKRLGAIITQITAGRGKHSLSVLVPMVEQKPLPSSLLAPSRQAFDESVRLCGVCETRDYMSNEQRRPLSSSSRLNNMPIIIRKSVEFLSARQTNIGCALCEIHAKKRNRECSMNSSGKSKGKSSRICS